VPCIAKWASTFLNCSCVRWTEFVTPTTDSFVGNNDSTLSQKILSIAKAETESMIKPDRMADDFKRKEVSVVNWDCLIHVINLTDLHLS